MWAESFPVICTVNHEISSNNQSVHFHRLILTRTYSNHPLASSLSSSWDKPVGCWRISGMPSAGQDASDVGADILTLSSSYED